MIRVFIFFLLVSSLSLSYLANANSLESNSNLQNLDSSNIIKKNIPVTNPNSKKANISPLPKNAIKTIHTAKSKKSSRKINKSSDQDILNAVSEPSKSNKKSSKKKSVKKEEKKIEHTSTSNTQPQTFETSTNYRIVEIKEGDFHPKDESGKTSDKKYSAYWLSLESEDGEDQESIQRANYLYFTLKAGAVMPTTYRDNSALSGSSGDTTYTVGAAFGRKIFDRLAFELEYMHKGESKAETTTYNPGYVNNKWQSKSDTFMFNVALDVIKHRIFRPYVKAGIGASVNSAGDYVTTTFSESNNSSTTIVDTYNGKTITNTAWQVGCGLNFFVNKSIDVNIEYMYIDRGKIETEASSSYSINNGTPIPDYNTQAYNGKIRDNTITIGLKIKF